jgi:hypothetical protein
MHATLPQLTLMSIAQLGSLPFMIIGIVEVNDSAFIDKKQKTMWTFGFIALTLITGIIYLLSERKKLLSN